MTDKQIENLLLGRAEKIAKRKNPRLVIYMQYGIKLYIGISSDSGFDCIRFVSNGKAGFFRLAGDSPEFEDWLKSKTASLKASSKTYQEFSLEELPPFVKHAIACPLVQALKDDHTAIQLWCPYGKETIVAEDESYDVLTVEMDLSDLS